MDSTILSLLCLSSFLAGILDATVGGGGFIIIPFLVFTGYPIQFAIGTSRIVFLMDSFSALVGHARKKNIDYPLALSYCVSSIFGVQLGAIVTSTLSSNTMSQLFGLFMILTLLFITAKKSFGLKDERKTKKLWTALPAGFFVGFLIGMFGGGVGIIIIVALVFVSGSTMLLASGTSQLIVWISNISAVAAYARYGLINFRLGLLLGFMAFLGAQVGVVVAHKVGNLWLRRALIVITVLSALKLLFF